MGQRGAKGPKAEKKKKGKGKSKAVGSGPSTSAAAGGAVSPSTSAVVGIAPGLPPGQLAAARQAYEEEEIGHLSTLVFTQEDVQQSLHESGPKSARQGSGPRSAASANAADSDDDMYESSMGTSMGTSMATDRRPASRQSMNTTGTKVTERGDEFPERDGTFYSEKSSVHLRIPARPGASSEWQYLGPSRERTPSPRPSSSPRPSPSLHEHSPLTRQPRDTDSLRDTSMTTKSLLKVTGGQREAELNERVLQLEQKCYQLRLQLDEEMAGKGTMGTLGTLGTIGRTGTLSMTGTTKHQNSLLWSMEERCLNLQKENTDLRHKMGDLRTENVTLKRVKGGGLLDAGESNSALVASTKEQLAAIKEDNKTLITTVQRLNIELSRYQARYRPPKDDELESDAHVGLPTRGPTPTWLVNTKFLSPLFVSYDDRIREREEALRVCEENLIELRQVSEKLAHENDEMGRKLAELAYLAPGGVSAFQDMQEHAKLVLEENEVLLQQLHLQNQKVKEMRHHHVNEASKMTQRMVDLESEKQVEAEKAEEYENRMHDLQRKLSQIVYVMEQRMPIEEHTAQIGELRHIVDKLKDRYNRESEDTNAKLDRIQSEKNALTAKLTEMDAENKRLVAENKRVVEQRETLKNLQEKYQKKAVALQSQIENVALREGSATKYLEDLIQTVEKTAEERDAVVRLARSQEKEKQRIVRMMAKGSATLKKLESKVKSYRQKATHKGDKGQSILPRSKAKDGDYNIEREVEFLHSQLAEKEKKVKKLTKEKKTMENELESVWGFVSQHKRTGDLRSLRPESVDRPCSCGGCDCGDSVN